MRQEQREADVYAVRAHIEKVFDDATKTQEAIPSSTARLFTGGLLSTLTPLSIEPQTFVDGDGKEVKLDGQQMRDLGGQLFGRACLDTLIVGLFRLAQPPAAPLAGSDVCANCGHTRDQHKKLVVTTRCAGNGGRNPLGMPLPCTCTAFVEKTNPMQTAPIR